MEFAFETTGVPEVLTQAVRSLDSLGTCAYVGTAPPGVTGGIPMLEAMTKGLTVRGVLQGDSTPSRTIPRLWDLHLPRDAAVLKAHDPTHFERVLVHRRAEPWHHNR